MAKPKGTAVETLRLVADATGEASPPGTKPDPRLIDLVRLLARQAAREFVHSTGERHTGDRSPS
ncbi:hypothetical protein SAMN02982994_1418 [Azospirillum lipoferum]|nr:hypothetical protein SAMN02982994_1418 [Azospirillum lipoferum]